MAVIGYATVEEDLEVVRAMRKAVGTEMAIMVDYNQSLTPPEAVRRLRVLDEEGLKVTICSGLYLCMAMTGFLLGGFSHSTWYKNPQSRHSDPAENPLQSSGHCCERTSTGSGCSLIGHRASATFERRSRRSLPS
jgi:hypothetical protein